MIRRVILALALALLGACNKGSAGPTLRLAQPSAVAVFHGFTERHASRWPYAAVANGAKDELILFDAVDDAVVPAPVAIRPLSIPLGAPRPALLASAEFPPPSGSPARPSLLVAVSAGSSALQLVRTWHDPEIPAATGPGLAAEEPIDLGSEILAIVAAPVVGDEDRVRVIAALAGAGPGAGEIGVVEYQWTGDPATTGSAASVGPGAVTRIPVGFQGLSLAVDPKNPRYVFAATVDEVAPGIFGVAEIDMAPSPASWTVRPIDAGAPTRLVAAYTLRERVNGRRGAYDQFTAPAPDDATAAFVAEPARRVYAWRDPDACGPRTDVACGIAVLDPVAGGVRVDPWDSTRRLPPITLPSRPVAMIVGQPAQHPPESDNIGEARDLLIIDAVNPRLTSGVLLLPSEDGRSYFADLARWETPSAVQEVSPTSGVGITSFRPSTTVHPQIVFNVPEGTDATQSPLLAIGPYLTLTPGFTPTDQWTVTFQGYLPAFAASRPVQVEPDGENLRVSFQVVPPGSAAPTQIVNVYDPALGVRVGDIVEFWTSPQDTGTPSCPDTTEDVATGVGVAPIEGKIVDFVRPDGNHPGGSVVVQRGDCVPVASGAGTRCDDQEHGPWNKEGFEGCWGQLAGARQARIRGGSGAPGAEELVVVGSATGYAGRAVSGPPAASGHTFVFTNSGEPTLACPLFPYPSNPASVPACTGACRTDCEQAAIARRARRLHLTSVACAGSTTTGGSSYCGSAFPSLVPPDDDATPFPPPEGPALAFTLQWRQVSAEAQLLVRDTRVSFVTRSGRAPASRFAGGGNGGPATQPTGGAWFDRTSDPSWGRSSDRYRFFVPHVGNLVLDLSPASGNSNTRILR